MKTKTVSSSPAAEPLDDVIRDYAYHLYEQSGFAPGHELDNWLEAKACILANIPRENTHHRLHRHLAQNPGGESQATAS